MSAHDRYLAGYSRSMTEVWCSNPTCENHSRGPLDVQYESEYGAGWTTPEECLDCGSEWQHDAPPEEDNE